MNIKPKCLIAVGLLAGMSLITAQAQAATQPASLLMKIYEVRASKNTDCSNPVSIFKSANPTPVDMVNNPTLGTGLVLDGTYHCLLFHVSEYVTVVPKTTDGACIAGQSYTFNTFNDPANDSSVNPDGGPNIVPGPGERDPWMYFSDSSVGNITNTCYEPVPTNCACEGPCPMAPLGILSDKTYTWVANYIGQLGDFGNSVCTLHRGAFSIR